MRKQTYQIRSNLTVTLNGVVLPKLPSASDINIGEIALNYKDGYETISIKNDNNEIVTFATLELLINYMEEYYGNAKIFKGTCATAAATTAKVVTCPLFKSTDLVKGTLIFVTFDLTNSGAVGSLTMNVNSTGAKSIKKLINNTAIASSNLSHAGELKANQTYLFEYDGTYWVCTTLDYNSTYSAMSQAEIDAGTSTSSRLMTPKLLRDNFYTETEANNLLEQKQNVDLIVTVSDVEDNSGTTDYSVSEILTLQRAGRNVYIKFGVLQLPLVYSTLSKLIYAMTVASDSATSLSLPPVILSIILEGTTATFHLLGFDPIAFNGIDLAPVATSGDYNDLDNVPTIPAAPGTLNTNNTTAQTVSSSEALSGAIKLHKVSKTGSYSDLIKPSTGIPKTDLASAVQTSLGKADSAILGVKVNNTALTPDANKAVNIDLTGYDKAPLVIEVDATDTTVPSGTYTNIGNALANGREVYIKINGDDLVIYLKLCGDLSRGRSKCYEFLGSTVMANVWNDNTLSIEFDIYAASDHNHGDIDNDGTLNHSQAISIANGDRIVITDASNNDKIQKTSTTFDGSTTTTALTPKGTWEPFLKTAPVTSVNGQTGDVEVVVPQSLLLKGITPRGHTLADTADSYYANELNNGEAGAWFISYSNGDILVKSNDTSKDQDGRVCLSSSWKSRLNYGGMTWANVGDILLVYKQSSLIVVYKVMSINEAGETRIGLMSPNDKIQVNKISNIEGNVNNLLGKIDKRLPYSTDSTNIGNAGNGAYTNVTAGRTNWLDTSTAGAAIKLGNLQIAIDNSGRLYSRNQTNNIWNVTNQLKTITETDLNNVFEPSVIGYATVTNGPSETGNYTVYTFTSSDYDGNGFRSILQIAINRNSGNQYMRTCFKKVDGSGTDFTSTDWKLVSPSVTSVNGQTGAVTITETQLSKGTATGTGNAVTDINVSNHQITLVKGATYATQSDIDTSIANLVDSAPETLDTLNELAAALGDDPNFATTVANQIGQKYTKPNTGIPASDLAAGVIPAAPGTLNTTATTAQTTSSSEALSGSITLHKVAKTGTYNDLIKPSTGIPKTDLASAVQTSLGKADTSVQNKGSESNIVVGVGNNSNISITSSNIGMETENSAILVGNDITLNTSGVVNYNGSRVATVTDLQGKQDVIRDLQTIRDGAADGATAIQGVKVNGTALTPDANKVVDVTVPTNVSDLTNDLNFVRRYHLLGLSVLLLTDSGEWAENSELNTPTIVFKFNQTEDNILLGEFYPTFMYCKLPKAANIDFYPNTILGLTSYITINLGEPLGYYNGNNAKPYWRTGWDVVPTVSLAFDNGSGSINTVPGINMTFVGVLDRGAIGLGTHYITICYNSIYRNYKFELLIFYDLELQRLHLTKPFVLTISDLGEVNTIETIKVNNIALTPDANKAVNVTVPEQIVSTVKVGLMSRSDVSGSGNLTIRGNIGQFPTVTEAGDYIVKTYMSSGTSNYTLTSTFGNNTYNITSSNGIINDLRQLTLNANDTWSGSITTVSSGTTLSVVVYKVGEIVTMVGPAAVSNDYNDLDNRPIIEIPESDINSIVTPGLYRVNQSIKTGTGTGESGGSYLLIVGLSRQPKITTLGTTYLNVLTQTRIKSTNGQLFFGGIAPVIEYRSSMASEVSWSEWKDIHESINTRLDDLENNSIINNGWPEDNTSSDGLYAVPGEGWLVIKLGDRLTFIDSSTVGYYTWNETDETWDGLYEYNTISEYYEHPTESNEDLLIQPGDSYETAFGKLEKAVLDNEETIAAALNDLNERLLDVDSAIQSKQDVLTSGVNLKTINNESLLGSGNITISGGSGGGGDVNVIETIKINGTALTPDANKAVNITSIPASIVTQDATHRFVSDTEKTTWNGKLNALQYYGESDGEAHVYIYDEHNSGSITLANLDVESAQPINQLSLGAGYATLEANFSGRTDPYGGHAHVKCDFGGIELKCTIDNETNDTVHLGPSTFTYNNKQIATTDQIPSAVTESTISGWGFTKNAGTVTSVKINNTTKNPTSGVVDLGTVITSETSLSKGTTSGSGNAVTDISVSGHLITLTKGTTFLTSETQLSKGTTTGSGNAVTDISVNGHQITLTKGTTFLTSHLNIKTINSTSLVGTGNITINGVPSYSSSDSGKVLSVNSSGQLVWITPVSIYSGSSQPSNSVGINGDLYIQSNSN